MNNTAQFHAMWVESRTRFSQQFGAITAGDLTKKLGDSPNSVGFLMRHIADVELLFAKNVFGYSAVKVSADTVKEKRDSGQWTQLAELLDYQNYAFDCLGKAILLQTESDWNQQISTQEFGVKTKAEAIGRIVSHTAYHAGQMAIVLKYGNH